MSPKDFNVGDLVEMLPVPRNYFRSESDQELWDNNVGNIVKVDYISYDVIRVDLGGGSFGIRPEYVKLIYTL